MVGVMNEESEAAARVSTAVLSDKVISSKGWGRGSWVQFRFLNGGDLHLVTVEERFQLSFGGLDAVSVPLEEGVMRCRGTGGQVRGSLGSGGCRCDRRRGSRGRRHRSGDGAPGAVSASPGWVEVARPL